MIKLATKSKSTDVKKTKVDLAPNKNLISLTLFTFFNQYLKNFVQQNDCIIYLKIIKNMQHDLIDFQLLVSYQDSDF